ncbi:hypothetical protein HYU21_03010 [Candidatus Woesearchaeota archaeon]|nr:hypothetical protein [Candidatus Woesearchaeota archaeon]
MKKNRLNIYKLLSLFSITIILTLSLLSCSSSEQVTGKAIDTSITAFEKASLLLVKVVDEKNQPLGDAGIYLNGVYKGKTNSYGESKGTKEIILNQENNIIRTEKSGYFPSRQETIQALPDQKQSITLTLTKEITTLAVRVLDENNFPVKSATVMLLADEDTENTDDDNYNKENSNYNKNKQNKKNKQDDAKKLLISDEN